MTTRLDSSTTIKSWASEPRKEVIGNPPRPEDRPSTIEGEARKATVRGITPNYKLGEGRPNYDLNLGSSGHIPTASGDFKVSQAFENYRLTIIDPKVRSNANLPSMTVPEPKIPTGDFPSEHSRRSQVKLVPLEHRRFRSVETKPITTSEYLTKSVDRHRELEASRLRDYLKAKEGDANQPWNKPGWPGPKPNDDEKMRELEHMRKSIERLEREAVKPKKNEDLDALHGKADDLLMKSRRNRAGYNAYETDLLKQQPEPVPHEFKEHVRDLLESRASLETANDRSGYVTDVSSATWQFSTQSFSPRSVVSVNGGAKESEGLLKVRVEEEQKEPRSIMKRRELETRDELMGGAGKELMQKANYQRSVSNVSAKPRVTETVQRFEEHKRTEEIERRVQRKERRERRSRHEWSERQGGGHRSNSLSRQHYNGYLPSNETNWRHETTRRVRDNGWEDSGMAHARYGSLSDSLRRGELKYVPNGEVREMHFHGDKNGKVHKSYSTRDVFHEPTYDNRSHSSWQRHGGGSVAGGSPFVEYPPTLPRHGGGGGEYRAVSKSRSYADWDDRARAGWKRPDDEMSRLEAEFRDSTLLMPLPNGKMHERDSRTEQIPGGYETYFKENRADGGRRAGRDGRPVDWNESSAEYSYKREQEHDGGGRRH